MSGLLAVNQLAMGKKYNDPTPSNRDYLSLQK
jgi:hypothetical protein